MSVDRQVSQSSNGSTIKKYPWTITSSTQPISNAVEIATIQDELNGLPIPEMPYGNNSLVIKNDPVGWEYSFTALEALRGVKLGAFEEGDGGVQVGYAKEWLQSRAAASSSNPLPKVVQAKPYDWTFTTTYPGHISSVGSVESIRFTPADPSNPTHRIPIEELSRPDPILFYVEVPLFEDELHDNGYASYTIRARVMPTSFFVLSRFCLRVDNVLFRLFDTRLYHSFSSNPPLVVRETSGWEASYKSVKRFLASPDLSPLGDPDFVYRALASLREKESQNPNREGGTGWKAIGTKVEVLVLPSNEPTH